MTVKSILDIFPAVTFIFFIQHSHSNFQDKSMNIFNSFNHRSSRPDLFCEKGVLRNLAKLTGKHLCRSLFFNKVADLRPATLFKKRPWRTCFLVDFVKFLKTPSSQNTSWRLLPYIIGILVDWQHIL